MRWLTIFVFTCIAIAALQAVLPVLLILLLLSVLWGVFLRPAEMLGFIGMLVFASAFQAHGLALIVLGGVLGFVALVRGPAPACPPESKAPGLLLDDLTSEELD